MDARSDQSDGGHRIALGGILLLFLLLSLIGIGWGLPSRSVDPYLFGGENPWSGEKIYRLAGAEDKFSAKRGADVDPDPLADPTDTAVPLTDTDEKLARIYLRYRLYTYQPDEMITMMALAGMNPRRMTFDPRLYQYGGLFIYPVGAGIGLCGAAGLIDVRSDVKYYLDDPDEFAKFYLVSRGYAAVWGLIGVLVVFAIGRRLAGARAGLLAALLFALMPVVIGMAHEGKPHLPGAVLMLLAVYCAMCQQSTRATSGDHPTVHRPSRAWWLMCICCGAAFGMVLSSWPIMILIPLAAILDSRSTTRHGHPSRDRQGAANRPTAVHTNSDRSRGRAVVFAIRRTLFGGLVAALVYLVTNPYIVINAFTNREVLASNFGNSLAMYRIDRIAEGFTRTLQLAVEGATLPIVVFGVLMLCFAVARKNRSAIPLGVTAVLLFLQFVCIGAGKPAEYGRFGVFTDTALAIAAACLIAVGIPKNKSPWLSPLLALVVVVWEGWCGTGYLWNFHLDTIHEGSRMRVRRASPLGPWTDTAFADTPVIDAPDPSRDADAGRSDLDTLTERRVAAPDPWRSLGPSATVFVIAEPAPYCCPPLPFHALDVRLFRDSSRATGACDDRASACLLLRAVDRTALTPSGPPGLKVQPTPDILPHLTWPDWWVTRRQTPISWANKPIEIWTAGVPFAP